MDKIKITVLEDGTIKTETDKVSMANHGGAEMLIRELVKAAGGSMKKIQKAGHTHSHDGVFHTH